MLSNSLKCTGKTDSKHPKVKNTKNRRIMVISHPVHDVCSDVSFRSHIGWDVVDHDETSSRPRNWYVNETDLFETSLQRLIDAYKKPTNLRRRNDVSIDT